MRAFLVFLLFLVWTAFARYDVVCRMLNLCGTDDVNKKENVQDIERSSDLDFVADDSVLLSGYDQFAFLENKITPILNDNNQEYLTGVLAYLNGNPLSQMTIGGVFLENERDSSFGIYENLGLARADAIRQWFTSKGVDENRIGLDSKETANPSLSKPLTFSAKTNARPDEYDIDVKPKYTFTNMTFSDITFEYNSDEFEPTKAFGLYADSMKIYLDIEENKNKTLVIIGHTDNVGSRKYNLSLGKRRAAAAKKHFVEIVGIPAGRIYTDTKGEDEPIAPNDTDSNREKNRRVNIKVQE